MTFPTDPNSFMLLLAERVAKLEARLDAVEGVRPADSLIDERDIRIDIYRSERTAPMTLRLTHIPTGIVVTVEGEKSQLQNKAKALDELEAKLKGRGWTPPSSTPR